ncbi:sodium:solute symporter [candidate division KSB1 bacterium]
MEPFDWLVVVLWVVGTSGVGLYFRRRVKTTSDYLLTGKRLNWWQSGVAHSADMLDATDFISSTGQAYRIGMAQIGYSLHGVGIGFILLSRWIVPLMYRVGVYTNAEYLELRYNTALRLTSVIIQTLYRFVAMGMVVYSVAVAFHVLLGVNLWWAVWGVMALTMLYVFSSGQLGVAMAAIPQVGLMIFASILVLGYVLADVGGFSGLATALADKPQYFHMAGHDEAGVPGGVYLMGLVLTLITYPIINQTVAQRFLAARSEVDARIGCFAGLVPWYLVAVSSCLVGFCAVVLYPDISSVEADFLYPRLLQAYLPSGLLGLAVAAMVVASMSTGAGIATALGGLFTVDIYARFIRPDAADTHYLRVTRLVAAATIIIGSLFARAIPAMGGLLPFYLAFTGSLFLPMTVPYIGGALYARAGRGSGLAAVIGGFVVGAALFLLGDRLPVYMSHPQWRPLWSFGSAWLVFFVWSVLENRLRGPIPNSDIAASLNHKVLGAPGSTEEVARRIEQHLDIHPQAARFSEVPNPGVPERTPFWRRPAFYEIVVTLLLILALVWWW